MMGGNPTSCVYSENYTHILCAGLVCFVVPGLIGSVVPGLTRDPFFLCNLKTGAKKEMC